MALKGVNRPSWNCKYTWCFQVNLHTLEEKLPEGLPVLAGENLLFKGSADRDDMSVHG